jgi:hypothetical protein
MIRLLIAFIIIAIGFIDTARAQKFSGQVYVMTENFTSDRCRPQIECDCCSSEIVFLTDATFIMVGRCIHNDSYYKGTYIVGKGDLTLKFDQLVVKETYNDETEEVKIETKDLKIGSAKFHVTSCNTDNVVLQRTDLKVLTKAFKESQEKGQQIIDELKKTKAWEQLQ